MVLAWEAPGPRAGNGGAVVLCELDVNGSVGDLLKVVSGRVLPCAPVSTFRIKLWMPGLLVSLTLTVKNASSIDDFMDDTLMSLKVSTSERVAICLASLDVD